jgi:hypothetical protein
MGTRILLALLTLAFFAYLTDLPTPLSSAFASIEEMVGGAPPYQCALLGVAAGLAFVTGNGVGLFGALVAGHLAGCF